MKTKTYKLKGKSGELGYGQPKWVCVPTPEEVARFQPTWHAEYRECVLAVETWETVSRCRETGEVHTSTTTREFKVNVREDDGEPLLVLHAMGTGDVLRIANYFGARVRKFIEHYADLIEEM
jgi:hypothetical protein